MGYRSNIDSLNKVNTISFAGDGTPDLFGPSCPFRLLGQLTLLDFILCYWLGKLLVVDHQSHHAVFRLLGVPNASILHFPLHVDSVAFSLILVDHHMVGR